MLSFLKKIKTLELIFDLSYLLQQAIQAYNFGTGFFDFIGANGGKYTKELAIKFSQQQYQKVKHTGMYHCLRPEAVPYQACYGDIVRP
ncbi:hypothetical protein Bmyc01_54580 [Bacillus mycoides]|nr:hypothetical protein Bmyc01_54580 [Bacillus mycoides]